MAPAECVDLEPDWCVLDMCSAPGGKAFTIAETMNNTGVVRAFDIYQSRVDLIKSGAERLGLTNVYTYLSDASIYNENYGKADRILCDVPCSGLGIIRRKPEIMLIKIHTNIIIINRYILSIRQSRNLFFEIIDFTNCINCNIIYSYVLIVCARIRNIAAGKIEI